MSHAHGFHPIPARQRPPTPEPQRCRRTGWSAALAFAPTRRQVPKAKPPAARLPVGAAVTGVQGTAAPVVSLSSTAVVFAPPSLVDPNAPKEKDKAPAEETTQPHGQGWGRKVKPPSMVLDEDVNGFQLRKGGGGKREGGGGKKKNKKVRRKHYILCMTPTTTGLVEQECARRCGVEPG